MHKPVERLKSEVTVEGTPTVILVGADKGGVGKTTVARTLLDYLAANKLAARAFDTETPKGTLHRFHPEQRYRGRYVGRGSNQNFRHSYHL